MIPHTLNVVMLLMCRKSVFNFAKKLLEVANVNLEIELNLL